jgi:hypothetical protein
MLDYLSIVWVLGGLAVHLHVGKGMWIGRIDSGGYYKERERRTR